MDRNAPPEIRLVRPALTRRDQTLSPALRILAPTRASWTPPAPLSPAERRRIERARGLEHYGELARCYVSRLHACGLIGPGTVGIQLAKGDRRVAFASQLRKVIVISPDYRDSPAVLLHELLHLSQRDTGPARHAYLGEATTAMLGSAVALRMDPRLPRSWDDLIIPMVAMYPGQLFLPVLHHLMRERGGERRAFRDWLRAIHFEQSAAERVDEVVEAVLTPAQVTALERSFQRAQREREVLGKVRCTGLPHRDCGHTLVDRLVFTLGNEYARYGCELEPALAPLRAGLHLPAGGLKRLWRDTLASLFSRPRSR